MATSKSKKSTASADPPWGDLCTEAFALVTDRKYPKVGKLLGARLKDQKPMKDDGLGGCFVAYGISLNRVSKPLPAIEAYKSAFACGGKYAEIAFYALAMVGLSMGQAEMLVEVEREAGFAESIDARAARKMLEPHIGSPSGQTNVLDAYAKGNPNAADVVTRLQKLFR